ncbi:MAG: hypothetical protein JRF72_18725 [Deltaproteobacteria bacterium]|jgi:hypothetical protein|nr:hypothetical protein [Deltaproteobacteria bacterium]
MVNAKNRYQNAVLSMCLALSLVAFGVVMLGGCATPSKKGRLQGNKAVTELFEKQQILPDHSYYFNGFSAIPYVIVGIDNQYTLNSSAWRPVKPDPDLLNQLITRMQIVYSGIPQGAWIIGPNDERLGIWYSTERQATVRLKEDNSVLLAAPMPPNMSGIP